MILGDTSDHGPALVSHAGGLVLAWKGSGNDYLNVMVSTDDGTSFLTGHKRTFGDASDRAPALVSHDGLHLAWKGSGNENLDVATLVPAALAGATPSA